MRRGYWMKGLEKNTGNIKEELGSGCHGSAKEVRKVVQVV
jgi:hypothetical protein